MRWDRELALRDIFSSPLIDSSPVFQAEGKRAQFDVTCEPVNITTWECLTLAPLLLFARSLNPIIGH